MCCVLQITKLPSNINACFGCSLIIRAITRLVSCFRAFGSQQVSLGPACPLGKSGLQCALGTQGDAEKKKKTPATWCFISFFVFCFSFWCVGRDFGQIWTVKLQTDGLQLSLTSRFTSLDKCCLFYININLNIININIISPHDSVICSDKSRVIVTLSIWENAQYRYCGGNTDLILNVDLF